MSSAKPLTTAQAAALLGVTRSLVLRWLRRGDFPGAERIGRDWLIPAASVRGYQRRPRGWQHGQPWTQARKKATT